jgi:hypothetical protein
VGFARTKAAAAGPTRPSTSSSSRGTSACATPPPARAYTHARTHARTRIRSVAYTQSTHSSSRHRRRHHHHHHHHHPLGHSLDHCPESRPLQTPRTHAQRPQQLSPPSPPTPPSPQPAPSRPLSRPLCPGPTRSSREAALSLSRWTTLVWTGHGLGHAPGHCSRCPLGPARPGDAEGPLSSPRVGCCPATTMRPGRSGTGEGWPRQYCRCCWRWAVG